MYTAISQLKDTLTDSARQHPFLSFLILFYIFSVIWGAYRFYSPIPQGDMWDGYIDFFLRLLNGDISAWWYQHNEHRQVFSRILFFIDLEYFGGLSKFLIPINVFFVFSIWLILNAYLYQLLFRKTDARLFFCLFALITVFSFSWKQDENITWAFQSQFWAAYVFPLFAFTFLAFSSIYEKKQTLLFSLACLFGIASAGTMANGILALPLLFVVSLILYKKPLYSVILALLSLAIVTSYLYYYETPLHHRSFTDNLLTIPFQTLIFFIEYLGSPIKSLYLSFILGVLHLYLIYVAFRHYPQYKTNPLYLSALAFFIYYLTSAAITSGGRADLGLKSALAGRYTTPSYMSLSLSIILYLYSKPAHIKFFNKRNITIVAVLLLGTQIRTVIKNVDKIHDGEHVQALQLELGVYEELPRFQAIADRATQKNISIFAKEPFYNKRELLNTPLDMTLCQPVAFSNLTGIDTPFNSFHLSSAKVSIPIELNHTLVVTNLDNLVTGFALFSRNISSKVDILQPSNLSSNDKIRLFSCK